MFRCGTALKDMNSEAFKMLINIDKNQQQRKHLFFNYSYVLQRGILNCGSDIHSAVKKREHHTPLSSSHFPHTAAATLNSKAAFQ